MRRILCLACAVCIGIPICRIVHAAGVVRRSLQPVVAERALVLFVHLRFASLTHNDPVVHGALLFAVTLCEPLLQLLQVSVLQNLVVVHHTGFALPLYAAVLVGLHLVHAAACAAVGNELHSVDLERRMLELRIRPAGGELPVPVCRSIGNVAGRIHIAAVAMRGSLVKEEVSLLHLLAVALGAFGALSYRPVCGRRRL